MEYLFQCFKFCISTYQQGCKCCNLYFYSYTIWNGTAKFSKHFPAYFYLALVIRIEISQKGITRLGTTFKTSLKSTCRSSYNIKIDKCKHATYIAQLHCIQSNWKKQSNKLANNAIILSKVVSGKICKMILVPCCCYVHKKEMLQVTSPQTR